MTKHLMALAALGAAVACTATARPNASYAPASYAAPISCEVRETRTRNGVLVEAIAHADQSVTGEYSFVITKSGAGGSSDIEQGGEFEARSGETLTLGGAEFNLERRGRYRAVLTVRDQDGVICRSEERS